MRRFWTNREVARLRALYPVERTDTIARNLGRTVSATYGMALKLGLRKSAEFLKTPESGRLQKGQTRPGTEATRFQKGHIPFNKGVRCPGWCVGRMRETQFRKGVRLGMAAKNWQPIGTVRPDSEGYLRIKVREAVYGKEACGFGNMGVWPMLQRHVWEQEKGPIPAGHVIVFRDHDRKNCDIGNLECISRAELARRNSYWVRLPRELAQAIQLNGALKRKLRRLNGEEQNVRSAGSPV